MRSNNFDNTHSPCNYITTRLIKTNDKLQPTYLKKPAAKMEISTRENIKFTEAHLLYSVLSMIAEIGGYVGLFLGVSIIQINHIFDKAIKMAFGILPSTTLVGGVPQAPNYSSP